MTTNPAAYRERLELLAAACDTDAFAHLPVVSRDNAKPFAADLRSALADLAKYEAALRQIDIDNAITSGSFGPLMDVGFSYGWRCARSIAREGLGLPALTTPQETDRG